MFKIDKNQVFTVKWNELEKSKDKLQNVSGLYFYHVNGKLMYIGKSFDLWSRFGYGYLKINSKVHKNACLMELISAKSEMVEVVFAPLCKDLLKEQETLFIQAFIPQFNKAENPRYQVRSIQRIIARIVNETNREWKYAEMREHLFHKWRSKVPIEMIDEALANKSHNLSRYCSAKPKPEVLMPRMNEA